MIFQLVLGRVSAYRRIVAGQIANVKLLPLLFLSNSPSPLLLLLLPGLKFISLDLNIFHRSSLIDSTYSISLLLSTFIFGSKRKSSLSQPLPLFLASAGYLSSPSSHSPLKRTKVNFQFRFRLVVAREDCPVWKSVYSLAPIEPLYWSSLTFYFTQIPKHPSRQQWLCH